MSARLLPICCLLSCVLLAAPALAQEGHPSKGTWVGYWGPTATENRLVIVMDYVGKNLPTSLTQSVQVQLAEIDGRDQVEIQDA